MIVEIKNDIRAKGYNILRGKKFILQEKQYLLNFIPHWKKYDTKHFLVIENYDYWNEKELKLYIKWYFDKILKLEEKL